MQYNGILFPQLRFILEDSGKPVLKVLSFICGIIGSRTLSKTERRYVIPKFAIVALSDDPSDLSALTPFFDWPASYFRTRRICI